LQRKAHYGHVSLGRLFFLFASKAGELTLKNSDLPLADAVIAPPALDLTRGRVYTDDPHFQKITGIHVVWRKT